MDHLHAALPNTSTQGADFGEQRHTAVSTAVLSRLSFVAAIKDAAVECQRQGNAAWVDLARTLAPLGFDQDTVVQSTAFQALSGACNYI